MSVGTIVTIVLLMAVLVLGLALIKNIFGSAKSAVDLTDSQLKEEISNIFGGDDLKKLAIYPARKIRLKKGSELSPLGFSIRNRGATTATFQYALEFEDSDCGLNDEAGNGLIVLRRTGSATVIGSNVMEDPILLEFRIQEDFPSCLIAYKLLVNGGQYAEIGITVEIIGR